MAKRKKSKKSKANFINPWPRDGRRTKAKVPRPKLTRVIDRPVPMGSTNAPLTISEEQTARKFRAMLRR
jgi:hypothetical protein